MVLKHLMRLAALATAGLLLAAHAKAAIIAEDHFLTGSPPANGEYAIGSIDTQAPVVTGFPGTNAWAASADEYGNYKASGTGLLYSDGANQLVVDAGSVYAERTKGTSLTTPYKTGFRESNDPYKYRDVIYWSFLLDPDGADAWGSVKIDGKHYLWAGFDQSGHAVINNSNGGPGSPVATSGATYSTSTVHLLVAKVVNNGGGSGQDRVYLYVDPDLESAPVSETIFADVGTNGIYPFATGSGSQLSSIGLATNFPAAGGTNQPQWDEFRVGETWAEVTPYVPEPATLGLMAMGGGAMLLLRRKRRP